MAFVVDEEVLFVAAGFDAAKELLDAVEADDAAAVVVAVLAPTGEVDEAGVELVVAELAAEFAATDAGALDVDEAAAAPEAVAGGVIAAAGLLLFDDVEALVDGEFGVVVVTVTSFVEELTEICTVGAADEFDAPMMLDNLSLSDVDGDKEFSAA